MDHIQAHQNLLICPHCQGVLSLMDSSLVCDKNHRYDINKKGSVSLIKSSKLKVDDVYNEDLFRARRRFIQAGFYQGVYDIIKPYINDGVWLDMGSGEGSHGHQLIQDASGLMVGFDLAKDAILMGTDFIYDNYCSILADLTHVPIANNRASGILNFLSPSNEKEMDRVLSEDGLIIKVVPGKEYLKELRMVLEMDEFEPTNYKFKSFEIIETINSNKTYPLSEENSNDLMKMTPLSQHRQSDAYIENITIDLDVLILRKKP